MLNCNIPAVYNKKHFSWHTDKMSECVFKFDSVKDMSGFNSLSILQYK